MDSRKTTLNHNQQVYGNFLIHWKYIKREKIAGAKKGESQWKYFYKDDTTSKTTANNEPSKTDTKSVLESTKRVKNEIFNFVDKTEKMVEDKTGVSKKETKDNTALTTKVALDKGKQVTTKLVNKASNKVAKEVVGMGAGMSVLVGTLLAKAIGKTVHETGEAIEQNVTEKRAEESRQKASLKDDPLPILPVKTEATTRDEDMNLVNPKYDRGTYAYTMNCSYCTAAYDLRMRGYDVEADGISKYDAATIEAEITSWYDGEEVKRRSITNNGATMKEDAERLEAELLSYGDGARGHMMLYWQMGGGHDVIWEIEHGDVVIRDCQTNEKLEVIDYLQYSNYVSYFRTDNIQPNENILETVRSRKG